uniref:ATPase family AAA domain containing 2 n=1 Tax=Sphaeramia orbicularis TaxID=375764 RepID=A0A672YDP7_9TELE
MFPPGNVGVVFLLFVCLFVCLCVCLCVFRLRPVKASWMNRSEDDDSEDSEQDVGVASGRCSWRPLGVRSGNSRDKLSAGARLADIDPMAVDQSVGFNSIGGLSGHISALKEMVVFPLLYPEVFDNFKIQPPRGCLFYGPPGTGKTLVARALSNECSHGNRKVSFFMRKGADCLSKWVGESERQLRLLFEQAYQMRPSIIFFDEIDGLAPVRSSRQDQIHSSIVSTLLALMDGLDSRGEVVVIGATNRLDSIDPALRRPGRFDREFLFGLPDRESRKEILKIHTRQWKPAPSDDFLDELAEKCVGYCGADIRAVCTEAALCALRRRYPQIYGTPQKLLLDVSSISVSGCDFVAAMRRTCPSARRSTASPAAPLSAVVQPLLSAALGDVIERLQRLFPHTEQGMKRKREPGETRPVHLDIFLQIFSSCRTSGVSFNLRLSCRSAVKQPTSHRPRMLLAGRPGAGQTSHLAPAVLHALERFTVHSLELAVLFGGSGGASPEEACAQVFCEARRTFPSILYLPNIHQWWEAAGAALRSSFLHLLEGLPSFSPVLLLSTCSVHVQQLDPEVQSLFRVQYGEVYTVGVPTKQERTDFFKDLILNQAAEAPPTNHKTLAQDLEVLPLAPPPPPRQLSEQERLRLEEQEEDILRELRLFLRNVTERLFLDPRFKAFTEPVDEDEVPAYSAVIKRPMDLSTLLTNIDEHRYGTVGDFMADADLIWQNALEYSPDGDATDRNIRHRACALKDTVRAIIRDELDEDFERICEEVKESRMKRGECPAASVRTHPHLTVSPPGRTWRRRGRTEHMSEMENTEDMEKGVEEEVEEMREEVEGVKVKMKREVKGMKEEVKGEVKESLLSPVSPPPYDIQPASSHQRSSKGGAFEAGQNPGDGRRQQTKGELACPRVSGTVNGVGLIDTRCLVQELLNRAVAQTDGAEVEPLEKLYALLAQCIYRHRADYNKNDLIKVRPRKAPPTEPNYQQKGQNNQTRNQQNEQSNKQNEQYI